MSMKIFKTNDTTWENQHETFTYNIGNRYELGNGDGNAVDSYNAATRGFRELIREAVTGNGHLRGLGAGWSWTPIAATPGIILETKALNTVFTITPASVSPAYTGVQSQLFLAQCGTGIWELSAFLKSRGLSLKTSGASNGQTIAGAISTGAHGSAFDVGAVQDYVTGLHLIVGGNRHVWLERASYPVVSEHFTGLIQAELVRDDTLFNAALVSFGSFGIIHGVMIETEPLYLLEAYMQQRPLDQQLRAIMGSLDFSQATLPCGNELPYHFQVLINPYDKKKPAYVTTMYKRPYRDNYKAPVRNSKGIGPGDDAPCFIGRLTDAVPGLVPTLVNKLVAGSLSPYEKQFGILGELFSNTTLHGKLLSAAIGVPVEQVNAVIDLLFAVNQTKGPFAGLFAFRYVKQSRALLAFTRFPYTCVIELDAAFSATTYAFYSEVWKELDRNNIPYTFHWGKVNELTPARLKKMYGDSVVQWKASRSQLMDPQALAVFTNPVIQQWGL
ncbi:FAD-binding protein [Chitinophaga japonensis]|uniref:D-arabinono-1,4-lactone oxidase n=1 Tax=Chitinophaga japonensis TaxID=104662 RepID=A0A562SZW8_CHIJA|nr:FAD-binding protein [Chitinophaga japonensis]TWI86376.1 D-arabinono-1,4-lactone oxidase [Chitinophaga japonensis]